MKRGLMIIDRGSREREAGEELEMICEKVKEKGNYDFTEFCFLEVVPPFIEDGMDLCLKKDVEQMTIVPYFLYPGRKVKIAVADAMKYQKDTKIKFLVTKPMTMHKKLVELVDNRVTTTLKENSIDTPKENVDVQSWKIHVDGGSRYHSYTEVVNIPTSEYGFNELGIGTSEYAKEVILKPKVKSLRWYNARVCVKKVCK